jgi:K+-sensing histidine kinase KdpD
MRNSIKSKNNYTVNEGSNEQNNEKFSLLSHISHGIRTPLNSIMGFSKLLNSKKMDDSKQKEYVNGILTGSNLLFQFVQNIMDLSQFEANNYSLRIKKYDINRILWDFTEDLYFTKNENSEEDINLMLVWENKVKDLKVETDAELLKKALQRLFNMVVTRFPDNDLEMGYRIANENSLSIFIRPANIHVESADILNRDNFFTIDESESFDYFNRKVLVKSVLMLGGELKINAKDKEFIVEIPIKN